MIKITFDESEPGFSIKRRKLGAILGYRGKKVGVFLLGEIGDRQSVCNALGVHFQGFKDTLFDGVVSRAISFFPSFVFFGLHLRIILLTGEKDPAVHEALRVLSTTGGPVIIKGLVLSRVVEKPPVPVAIAPPVAPAGMGGTDWR